MNLDAIYEVQSSSKQELQIVIKVDATICIRTISCGSKEITLRTKKEF